ncbi:MAG TPA: DUF308 domain-containing protein [Actinomycetota bacterium]|nr:DUF308 domain-containing protein [Actinomycetota bacterium]
METTADVRAAEAQIGRSWWIFLITGILWLLGALIVLRFDYTSIVAVGVLLGVVILVVGANEFLIAALVDGWKWVHVLLGILFVIGGIAAMFQPGEAFWALASILGLLLLLKGSFDIVVSIASRGENPVWGLGLAVGILEVLLAFWVSQQYFRPRAALIILWVGMAAIFRGVSEIVLAFQLRKMGREARL